MAYSIMLDAGHGGSDPGAVYKGRQEKDDNLSLTKAVGEILEKNGVKVLYTEQRMNILRRLNGQNRQMKRMWIILFLFTGIAVPKRINIREWRSWYIIKAV